MSTKYKRADEVPSNIICQRLKELATAVTKGEAGIRRAFYMSIPAQCDHDADLVLSAASKRISDLEKRLNKVDAIDRYTIRCSGCGCILNDPLCMDCSELPPDWE